jgi:hypothetical protein
MLYGRVWYSDIYVAKYTVWESMIQWFICNKVYSMEECGYNELFVTMCKLFKIVK